MGKMISLAGLLVSVASLGACSTDNTTPLNDLHSAYGATHLEIVADTQVNVLLHIEGDGCATLGDDVTATFDGQVMEMSRGGYAEDASGCYPIAFWLRDFDAKRIGNRERASGAANLVISDASARWAVAPTQLFGNDLEIDAATSEISWPNVDRISTMRTIPDYPLELNADASAATYPAGAHIQMVQASAHPIPSLCSGPGQCSVDMYRVRDFGSTLPQ